MASCLQAWAPISTDLANNRGVLERKPIETKAKIEAGERRNKFEEWRHEVALDAANEAFNASAGRLRKLYAVRQGCAGLG